MSLTLVTSILLSLLVYSFDSALAQYDDLDLNGLGDTTTNSTSTWDYESFENVTEISFEPTTVEENWPIFTDLTEFKSKRVMRPGNMIKLKCQASGEPEPTIKWTKDGKEVQRKLGHARFTKWTMTLDELISDDSGSYTCTICIDFNCINFTTLVEVVGKTFRFKIRPYGISILSQAFHMIFCRGLLLS